MEKQNNSELGSYTDALKKVQELQVENLGIIEIEIHTFSFSFKVTISGGVNFNFVDDDSPREIRDEYNKIIEYIKIAPNL